MSVPVAARERPNRHHIVQFTLSRAFSLDFLLLDAEARSPPSPGTYDGTSLNFGAGRCA